MSRSPVIGLEIHAQLLTRTKLFCACSPAYGDPPNTHLCPVCLGLPGALPTLNREALTLAVRAALALGFHLHGTSRFARKNYFYPDLPKGYQITQYDSPLAVRGSLPVHTGAGRRPVALTRLHIEEDAGKSFHAGGPDGASTLLDFNRAGVPLVEIVTEPEIRSPEEAGALLRRIRQVLVALGVCSGRMEEGALRCDANVSLRADDGSLGPKVEVKNLNSFRFVERALSHEVARQGAVLDAGGTVRCETRLFDEARGVTAPMRSKEESQDYRYFPEPDLPPLELDAALVETLRAGLPELPHDRRDRFVEVLGLTPKEAETLVDDPPLAAYFERVVGLGARAKRAANWILGEVLRTLKGTPDGFPSFEGKVPPEALTALISSVDSGELPHALAKAVFARMVETGDGLPEAVRATGADSPTDEAGVVAAVDRALEENPGAVSEFFGGRERAFGFLVGAAMRLSGGSADPALVNRILKERLRHRGA